jgi:hypothetical protein
VAEVEDKTFPVEDTSGGIQVKTSRFLQKDNEVNVAENISFEEIGGFGKRVGYTQQNDDIVSTTSTSTSSSTTTTSTSTSTSQSTSTSSTTT